MEKNTQKEVLLIFKTHLDIGFTDFSRTVIERYLNDYLPAAIRVGYELRGTETPFIWTVGSWLIMEALKRDPDGTVEQAVRDGILSWHGLPFTTHTELEDPHLFRLGLEISRSLDRRFGTHTTGAKMTDVPGHTIGMVPLMREAGLAFLHLGVNPATPIPKVPELFRWKCGEDEITVMYEGDYGLDADFGDFAVCFAHTGDNRGPQSAENIVECYRKAQEKFPGAHVRAATLNDIAERVGGLRDLPVVTDEIGDTWIHGAGTDPMKVSHYRSLLRKLRDEAITDERLWDNLLLVPEHTWGMDQKTYFRDDTHYFPAELKETEGTENRRKFEASWEEQRSFVKEAEDLLGVKEPWCTESFDETGFAEVPVTDDPAAPEIFWQVFDRSDYERYEKDYMRLVVDWSVWDFTKVGMPDIKGFTVKASPVKMLEKGDARITHLRFDAPAEYGLPELSLYTCGDTVEIRWSGMKQSRLPQACFVRFPGMTANFRVRKMGQEIDPYHVIGSPYLMACEDTVTGNGWQITTLDAPLVLPFGRRLLQYAKGLPAKDLAQDLHFCLYDNIWNTNFPMWYGDDAAFRFTLKKN